MKTIHYLAVFLLFMACTVDRTSLEDRTIVAPLGDVEEVLSFNNGDHKITLAAHDGKFYTGYNSVYVQIRDVQTNALLKPQSVHFLPIMTMSGGAKHSCPHRYEIEFDNETASFSGYSVFTMNSSDNGYWDIFVDYSLNGKTYHATQRIEVHQQTNKNLGMTSFTGNDGERYYIALTAPQVPKVAKNELVAGIFKYDKPDATQPTEINGLPNPLVYSYSIVDNFLLELDPRMPEPSMGNHSSPYNEHLKQGEDKFYHGVVNYTMDGDWTLNFILKNPSSEVVKGTVVPSDFTPGKDGVKSELYIDVSF